MSWTVFTDLVAGCGPDSVTVSSDRFEAESRQLISHPKNRSDPVSDRYPADVKLNAADATCKVDIKLR